MSARSHRRREWNGSMRKRKMYLSVEDVAEVFDISVSFAYRVVERMNADLANPSGSLKPSKEDIALTGRMQKLCMLAGIPVIDHVILGNDQSYFSFREKQILPMEQIQYSVDLNDINLKVAEKEAENYGYEKPHKKSIKESLEENRKKIASGQKTSGVKKKRETTIE